ncbi:uncharacterized protein E0L32_009748 [Thyridium curvatum]|uniref:SDR family oxidoreductase n=1 Tax=Thyridium curvatum TaxID=1093900 RepID=A0A507AVD6_9PEZI|nr:uncharacterized protein E0L32_009748 [Thyridium curvatum]TPX08808.1 hypothetical protein E0L32_009748 [Thyridium curvatum]
MGDHKPVALVIGASRGIGRQVAIHLASNGYRAERGVSCRRGQDEQRARARRALSTRSKFASVHDPDGAEGDRAGRRRSPGAASGHARPRQRRRTGKGHRPVLRPPGRRRLQFRGDLVGIRREDASEAVPLMQGVNVEGLYATVQAALPHFARNGWSGRIIVVSPPIYSRFFRGKTAYAMGKVGMSVLTKGLAMDWQREGKTGMAITSIWPAVAIQSAATPDHPSVLPDLRKPDIFADAILAILRASAEEVNGCLELDEDFLRRKGGVSDFSGYSVVPGATPRRIMPAILPDLTVAEQDDEGQRIDSSRGAAKL